jgi:hypothetical protein
VSDGPQTQVLVDKPSSSISSAGEATDFWCRWQAADSTPDLVKYTRFDKDQEGFTGDVRGHSTGITASKTPSVYTWLLDIKPRT